MTATEVRGLAVVADEPTKSSLPATKNGPVFWPRVRSLLLEDGDLVYGCAECDVTDENAGVIRSHLARAHRDPNAKPTTGKRARKISAAQLVKELAKLEAVEAQRDEWRARARKAEHELDTLRRLLKGTDG